MKGCEKELLTIGGKMSITEIKIKSIQDVEQIVLETQYDDKLMHYR